MNISVIWTSLEASVLFAVWDHSSEIKYIYIYCHTKVTPPLVAPPTAYIVTYMYDCVPSRTILADARLQLCPCLARRSSCWLGIYQCDQV